MAYSHYRHIGIKRDGDVLEIVLQGPHPQNGFNGGMHTEFSRVFSEVREDDARVVVISAVGDYFSVSGDMDWYLNLSADDMARLVTETKMIINDMLSVPQPLVVKLNGDAYGLGAAIVSFADFIVAAEGAKVGDRHTLMGLVAGDGAALTWPLAMGPHRAREFFLLQRDFTAEELHEIGIVSKVVAREHLDAAVDDMVKTLASQPPRAVQWTKMVLNRMVRFSAFLSSEAGMGHLGWTWHQEPSQRFLEDLRQGLAKHPD